jgi:hypothetical protein
MPEMPALVILAILALVFWKPWLLLAALACGVLFDLWSVSKNFSHPQGPREAALREAAQGATAIVLALLAVLKLGQVLPAWSPLAALAVSIWGGLRLYNGAKFSVGWRDPKLTSRALVRVGVGLAVYWVVWHGTIASVPLPVLEGIGAFLMAGWPYSNWAVVAVIVWCVVGGATKLFLVLRGFPAMPPWDDPPAAPYGTSPFTNPNDAAKGLKK